MNSLRARLLFSAGCVLLAFVLLTTYILDNADLYRAEASMEERLKGLTYTLLGALEVTDDGNLSIADAELPDPRLRQPDSGLSAVILSPDNSVLWHSLSTLDLTPSVPAVDVGQWRFFTPQAGKHYFSMVFGISWTVNDTEQLFRLAVIESDQAFRDQRRIFRRSLWLGLMAAAGLLLLLLLSILHWGLLPLQSLAREVKAVETGRQTGIEQRYPEELRPLATALNALLRNERRRQQRYRHALADLAHSLKTPLAALRNQRSELANTPDDPVQHMQQIIDYQLHKAVAGSGSSFATPMALAPLAGRVLSALAKVHADRGLRFENRISDSIQLRMEESELLEVLGNLLENAARFAQQRVSITATAMADQVHILVDDDGPGFPPEGREALLQRGIRADSHHPGQGIGLAVVAEIIEANEGQLSLEDAQPTGARVRIRLPNV